MTEGHAMEVKADVERVLRKHGLWWKCEEERRPGLRMIRITDISIKVTEAEDGR